MIILLELQWATAITTYRHWFATYRHWFATYRHGFATCRQLSQPADTYFNLPTPISTFRHLFQPSDTYFNLLLTIISKLVNEFGHSSSYRWHSSPILDTRRWSWTLVTNLKHQNNYFPFLRRPAISANH